MGRIPPGGMLSKRLSSKEGGDGLHCALNGVAGIAIGVSFTSALPLPSMGSISPGGALNRRLINKEGGDGSHGALHRFVAIATGARCTSS